MNFKITKKKQSKIKQIKIIFKVKINNNQKYYLIFFKVKKRFYPKILNHPKNSLIIITIFNIIYIIKKIGIYVHIEKFDLLYFNLKFLVVIIIYHFLIINSYKFFDFIHNYFILTL